jgi:hypothetical protein
MNKMLSIPQIEARIQHIKTQLPTLGDLRPGSLSRQYNVCGNPGCRCKDPEKPRRHGPYSRASSRPQVQFQEQQLTSFGGLLIFQQLFGKIQLKERLHQCSAHLAGKTLYQPHGVVLWLIVHLLLGFRKLRDIQFYKEDPLVRRVLGLKVLPDVSTLSRLLAGFDEPAVAAHQGLNRQQVLGRLAQEGLARVTLDLDGSVLWASKHAEGTAVGFNKQERGARSYYPLFCTVAQTAQVLDVLHRSGNVHDSNGAVEFVCQCVGRLRQADQQDRAGPEHRPFP